MVNRIRVVVVSYLPWRNDVNVGNTLSNLFGSLTDRIEFANIYFKGGMPANDVAERYFYIPESQLARSILTRRPVGNTVKYDGETTATSNSEMYDKARQLRWESLLLVQDMIGVLGKWHSEKLDRFIEDFKPQFVFGPLGRVPVANMLMEYIHTKYGVPMGVYAWDDHYSLHKHSLSPFFWVKTFLERRYIRSCAKKSDIIYTITEDMKAEYSGYFGKECKLLYKSYDFGEEPEFSCTDPAEPLKFLYMGNIGSGRWQELAKLARAIMNVNNGGTKAQLDIYTLTPVSNEMKKALNLEGGCRLMDAVPTDKVMETMSSADVLVHVEPSKRRELDFFRLSFSTKIVDYMYSAKCILAAGGNTAAMSYLKNNDAAVIVHNADEYMDAVMRLVKDRELVREYSRKAWKCGSQNHQKNRICETLYSDIRQLTNAFSGGNYAD